MLYHALRLACITISSFKTWKAVVDSGDRSQARRHLFLWFLTLAGLALEPIADSLSQRVPMYESCKIVVAGWLLLAQFYLSTPAAHNGFRMSRHSTAQYTTHREPRHITMPKSSGQPHEFTVPAVSDRTLMLQRHVAATNVPAHTLKDIRASTATATQLDFGRFKRDLERRQSRSVASLADGHDGHAEEEEDARTPLAATMARSTVIRDRAASRSIPASALGNPFGVSTIPPRKGKSTTTATIAPAVSISAQRPVHHRPLQEQELERGDVFQFGAEQPSRKRPLPTLASEMLLSARPIARQGSRRRAIEQKISTRPPYSVEAFQEAGEETGSARMNKRLRQVAEAERLVEPLKEIVSSGSDTNLEKPKANHDPQMKRKEQPATTAFARPKPPGKNRRAMIPHFSMDTGIHTSATKSTLIQRRNSREFPKHAASTSVQIGGRDGAEADTEAGAGAGLAGLDLRMKHVRDWLKERNPPAMISPPLSMRSERTMTATAILRKDQKPTELVRRTTETTDLDARDVDDSLKRKALRQLEPISGPKRRAEDQTFRRSRGGHEDSRIYPQPNDTIASLPPLLPRLPPLSRSQSESKLSRPQLTPSAQRGQSSTKMTLANGIDPLRDQPENDPFLPSPLNWSRFQKPVRSALKRRPSSSLSASVRAVEGSAPSGAFTFRSTTPMKSDNPFIARTWDGGIDEDTGNNSGISPLVKLRQSQLKQRQQDDFFGIRREEENSATAEGTLTFNATLDAWEREDDDALAMNAAREAAQVESRGQRGRQNIIPVHDGLSGLPVSSPLLKDGGVAEQEHLPALPAPSLLRTIPFNGESSRRPVPDLHSKRTPPKEIAPSQHQHQHQHQQRQRTVGDFGSANVSNSGAGSTFIASRILNEEGQQRPQRPRPYGVQSFSVSTAVNPHSSSSNSFGHNDNSFSLRGTTSLTKRSSELSGDSRENEDAIAMRRQKHPGLYTPSKKKPQQQQPLSLENHFSSNFPNQPPHSPHAVAGTPTVMSRYIQPTHLSDDE
ncbi:hypothetical protein EDD11_005824 [Mortierella claussenii]|nr:hypothetical protein EDD11_005824 [Mortierella claussenii]